MKFKREVTDTTKIFEAVSLFGLIDEMVDILPIIDKAYIHHGFDCVCTSGTEWFYTIKGDPFNHTIHSLSSDHYKRRAVDMSCSAIPDEMALLIQNEIQSKCDALRPGYYVLYHGLRKHFHIGYRPQ